jgi:ribosome-binding protein aMBF1 (putative translation factor)
MKTAGGDSFSPGTTFWVGRRFSQRTTTTEMERKKSMADLPIGIAVFKVRVSRGLTQQQVADRMSCKRPYISKVESGFTKPAMEQFVRICDAMQVEPWKVLKFTCKLKDQIESSF